MNPLDDALPTLLARLQLTALRDRLDTLLDEAARRELNLREALTFLCQAEVARREQRRLEMATRLAKFPFARTLDGFDFEAQPSLDPHQLRELALCRWVGNGDCLLLLGPPGDGKTHLAIALGTRMVQLGYRVRFLDPWPDFPTDDALADTARMNRWIEDEIRRNPAQYLWVHKRFKTRPPGEPPVYG